MEAERVMNIIRRHKAFRDGKPVERPLICFTVGIGTDAWSHWRHNAGAAALRSGRGILRPEDLKPAEFLADGRSCLTRCDEIGDDALRAVILSASIPWLEAAVGRLKADLPVEGLSVQPVVDGFDHARQPLPGLRSDWEQGSI